MEKKEFNITIDASREKVWNTLFDDVTYREWTTVFTDGSMAETDWKKGSKALFLDAKGSGMVSVIAENKPNEYMSIKHLGVVKDRVEDLESAKTEGWAGALENYTLKTVNRKTELIIDISTKGMTQNFLDYFEKTWPIALKKVKEVAERK